MSTARRLPVLAPLACCALLLAVGGRVVHAAVPAAPRQADAALSPEEAVAAIKPLQLQAADLPEGFGRGATTVDTPASDAVAAAGQGADPYAALQASQAEGTQACSVQQLMPPAGSSLATVTVHICLMADQSSAQNVVQNEARAINPGTGSLTPMAPPAELVLGDGAATLWQIRGLNAAGRATTGYDVRWSRGIVAFELQTALAPGQTEATGTAALSQRIDVGEAGRATVMLPQATVQAPVSETQRVYSALAAQSALQPPAQPPAAQEVVTLRTLQLPVETVLLANNPTATLALLDQTYGRIAFVNEVFNFRPTSISHAQRITVDATPGGALAELQAPDPNGGFVQTDTNLQPIPGGTFSMTELTPQVQIGDTTREYKHTVTYADARNNVDTYTLRWTHGPVMLQARVGALVDKNMPLQQQLIPWVQQIDQDYLASPLAAMMRLPATHGPAPVWIYTAPTHPAPAAVQAVVLQRRRRAAL